MHMAAEVPGQGVNFYAFGDADLLSVLLLAPAHASVCVTFVGQERSRRATPRIQLFCGCGRVFWADSNGPVLIYVMLMPCIPERFAPEQVRCKPLSLWVALLLSAFYCVLHNSWGPLVQSALAEPVPALTLHNVLQLLCRRTANRLLQNCCAV